MTPTVRFYFDYSSPFSYLAATQVERVAAENHGRVDYRPVLLGAVFKALGGPIVPLFEHTEQRRRWLGRDMLQWADEWGVALKWPSGFPLNTIAALRMTLAADEADRPSLVRALFHAGWVEDRNIADKALLVELADRIGLDGKALVARTEEQAIKDALRAGTEAAMAEGLFGVPTFIVDGAAGSQFVFGQDRFEFVARALRGEAL